MAFMYSAQFLNSVIKAYDIRGVVGTSDARLQIS